MGLTSFSNRLSKLAAVLGVKTMNQYLASSIYIDWQTPEVLTKAQQLATNTSNQEEIARRCFEFVRDEINHSWDHQ